MLAIGIHQKEAVKCFLFKWKSESSWLNKDRKKCTKVAKIYSKNKSSCGIVKEKEEIQASFAVTLQTTKDIATVHGKHLTKMEKTVNLYKILRDTTFTSLLVRHLVIMVLFITGYCY